MLAVSQRQIRLVSQGKREVNKAMFTAATAFAAFSARNTQFIPNVTITISSFLVDCDNDKTKHDASYRDRAHGHDSRTVVPLGSIALVPHHPIDDQFDDAASYSRSIHHGRCKCASCTLTEMNDCLQYRTRRTEVWPCEEDESVDIRPPTSALQRTLRWLHDYWSAATHCYSPASTT